MPLNRAQQEAIHAIFQNLRTDFHYSTIDAHEITSILSNPNGEKQELSTLNYAHYFKSDAMAFVDLGDVGHAENVFKEVAKVICKSNIPKDWAVTRALVPQKQDTSAYDDQQDILEYFSWTHNGITYEISSDRGDNWYFKGTFTHK